MSSSAAIRCHAEASAVFCRASHGGSPHLAVVDSLTTMNIYRFRIFFLLSLAALWSLATLSLAAPQNVRAIAEREIARRQAGVFEGQAALERGNLALQAKDFARAHDEFRTAVNFLPDALTTADQHDKAVAGFCESGAKLAEQRIAEGKYAEAEQVVREAVSDRYDQTVVRRSSFWPSSDPATTTKRWDRVHRQVEEVKKC